jgi:hypothetical protein
MAAMTGKELLVAVLNQNIVDYCEGNRNDLSVRNWIAKMEATGYWIAEVPYDPTILEVLERVNAPGTEFLLLPAASHTPDLFVESQSLFKFLGLTVNVTEIKEAQPYNRILLLNLVWDQIIYLWWH